MHTVAATAQLAHFRLAQGNCWVMQQQEQQNSQRSLHHPPTIKATSHDTHIPEQFGSPGAASMLATHLFCSLTKCMGRYLHLRHSGTASGSGTGLQDPMKCLHQCSKE